MLIVVSILSGSSSATFRIISSCYYRIAPSLLELYMFSGVGPFSGNVLMPTHGIPEFGRKVCCDRVLTKSVFRISGEFYSTAETG
jgi:hypothetical protein